MLSFVLNGNIEMLQLMDISQSISATNRREKQWTIKWLLTWEIKGKASQLTEDQKKELKTKNEEKPFDTAKEVKKYIEDKFKIKFSLHYVQKLLKKNFDFHTKKQD